MKDILDRDCNVGDTILYINDGKRFGKAEVSGFGKQFGKGYIKIGVSGRVQSEFLIIKTAEGLEYLNTEGNEFNGWGIKGKL